MDLLRTCYGETGVMDFSLLPEPALSWIIDEPCELQSKVHQLAGGDPEEDHDRHGAEQLKPIYGQPTSAFAVTAWHQALDRRLE